MWFASDLAIEVMPFVNRIVRGFRALGSGGCDDLERQAAQASAALAGGEAGAVFGVSCRNRGLCHRPGSDGQRPARASIAMLIAAWWEWNPNARRTIRRSWVFSCSTRAFDSRWRGAASIPERCSVIVRTSLTNGKSRAGRRHRRTSSWRSCERRTTGSLEFPRLCAAAHRRGYGQHRAMRT